MIRNNDIHKNLFINYDDKYWLENNITKAFLSAFDALEIDDKLKMLKEFNLTDNYNNLIDNKKDLTFDTYLQKKPNTTINDNLDNVSVKLFAFSPTGKAWNAKNLSIEKIMDNKERKKNVLILLKEKEPNIEQIKNTDEELYKNIIKEAEKEFDDIKKNLADKGNSIPDGWIIISNNTKVLNVIILENKKWDLDPYQLINHIEKSLKKEYKKEYISFSKYDDIYNFFTNLDLVVEYENKGNKIILDFLEYLTFLEYEPIDNDLKVLINKENDKNDYNFDDLTKKCISKRIDNIIENEYKDFFYKKSGKQLYPKVNDDNVNIFYDIYIHSNKLTIDISSEIGVRFKDFNINLMKKLNEKQNDNKFDKLIKIYDGCIWNRFCKIGQVAGTKYLNIKEYKCIGDYIDDIKVSEGVYRRLSKSELMNEFIQYNECFKNYNDGKKGVLEYFRIISRKCYEQNETIKYSELKEYIVEETNKHIEGLKIINEIANE